MIAAVRIFVHLSVQLSHSVMLFQILKDDAVKLLHSICQQIWKTQQWPQDWKESIFIPIPKKAQTTAQLHSSYMQNDAQNCSPIALQKKVLLGFWIKLQLNILSA